MYHYKCIASQGSTHDIRKTNIILCIYFDINPVLNLVQAWDCVWMSVFLYVCIYVCVYMCTYTCFLTQHLHHMVFTIYTKTIQVWAYTWSSASRVCAACCTHAGLEAQLDARVKCFGFVSCASTPVSQPKSTNGVFHFYAHHSLQGVRERHEAPHCYGYMSLRGPHYIHQNNRSLRMHWNLDPVYAWICVCMHACLCVCLYVRTPVLAKL